MANTVSLEDVYSGTFLPDEQDSGSYGGTESTGSSLADFYPDDNSLKSKQSSTVQVVGQEGVGGEDEEFGQRPQRFGDLEGFHGEARTDSVLQNIGLELEDLKNSYMNLGSMLFDDPVKTLLAIKDNFGPAMVESYSRWVTAAKEGRLVEALEKYPVQAIQDLTLPLSILAGGSGAIVKAAGVGGQVGSKVARSLAKTAHYSNIAGTIADPVGGGIGWAGQKAAGKLFRRVTGGKKAKSILDDDILDAPQRTEVENVIEGKLIDNMKLPAQAARKVVDDLALNPEAFIDSPEISNLIKESIDEVSAKPVLDPKTGSLTDADMDALADGVIKGDAESFLPDDPSSPIVGRQNLDYMNSNEDINRLVAYISDKMQVPLDKAARGVRSWVKTGKAAQDLGMGYEDVLAIEKGMAKNAEQTLAFRTLLNESQIYMQGKASIAKRNPNPTNLVAFKKSMQLWSAVSEKAAGIRAEAGRALNIYKKIPELTKATDNALREIVDSSGGAKTIEDMANAIAGMDADQVGRAARKMNKVTGWDKFREAWYSSLLSGLTTHVVNLGSNALVTAYAQGLENFAASAVGFVSKPIERAFGGSGKRVSITAAENMGRLRGMGKGFTKAFRTTFETFKTGESPDIFSPIELRTKNAINGKLGYIVRTPLRMLEAGDTFFKTLNYSSEIEGLAVREAMQLVEKGNLAKNKVSEYVANATMYPSKKLEQAALNVARYHTFTNPLGGDWITEGAKVLQQARNNKYVGKPLQLIVPFVRTPANIMKFAVERTPFALMLEDTRTAIKAGGVARDRAIARIGMGTALAWFATDLALKDKDYFGNEISLTGGMSTNRKERDTQYATGFQPYSIRINDKYYSYARFEPLGSIVGIASDFAHLHKVMNSAQYKNNEKDMEKIPALIAASFAKNFTSKTYMRGLAEGLKAFDDPDRYMGSLAANLGSTVVPTAVAQFTRFNDPYLRDARSLIEKIRSRVPGQSESLPARVNIWGEDIKRETWASFINPVYKSTAKNDKTTNEMIRLEVFPGMVGRRIGGVNLTPVQYRAYAQMAGQWAKEQLDVYIKDPSWDNQGVLEQKALIHKIINVYRDKARRNMTYLFKDLRQEIQKRKLERQQSQGRGALPKEGLN